LGLDHCSYDASSLRGGHIVLQSFPYEERNSETNNVCLFMERRQKDRRGEPSRDKMNNPIIAISGSPGCGKSTFLANFPMSSQYLAYTNSKNAGESVVSTMTFNSSMDGFGVVFGLRIIYGCIISMGFLLFSSSDFMAFILRAIQSLCFSFVFRSCVDHTTCLRH
jgi:hypothetical protein